MIPSTVLTKSSFMDDFKSEIAFTSLSILAIAISQISSDDFINTFLKFFIPKEVFFRYICFSGNIDLKLNRK